jgi:hypothetical protein
MSGRAVLPKPRQLPGVQVSDPGPVKITQRSLCYCSSGEPVGQPAGRHPLHLRTTCSASGLHARRLTLQASPPILTIATPQWGRAPGRGSSGHAAPAGQSLDEVRAADPAGTERDSIPAKTRARELVAAPKARLTGLSFQDEAHD